MSEPDRVHLVSADGALTERYRTRAYLFTMCGQVMADSDLPPASCPDDGCECEIRYCQECIRFAVGWNTDIQPPARVPDDR
ncbi:MAG: hypothetical protein M3Y48_23440 [Actinomycetota bacterium]|nr:hypothetical protein [Actinomycetota bacterium]